jgi:hypothetical protein
MKAERYSCFMLRQSRCLEPSTEAAPTRRSAARRSRPLLFFMPMPLQPLLGGFLHDVRSGSVKVKRGLLDGPYDVRIHGRQELSLVALRGLSAPSWRRFVVGHGPAYAW